MKLPKMYTTPILRMCWWTLMVLVVVMMMGIVDVKVEAATVHDAGAVSDVFWQAIGPVTVNQLVKNSPKSGLNGSCFSAANNYSNLRTCLRSQCVSADDVSKLYGVTSDEQLGARNLSMTSAGLLYVMTQKSSCSSEIAEHHDPPTAAAVWGYGFLFVTLINICSLLGACVLPCLHSKVYKVLLLFMVALAVGTLVGSGLLVLIPEALELTEENHTTFLWKMTTVMGGVFLFFMLERIMRYINNRRENTAEKRARDQEAMQGTYTSFFQRQPPEANPIPLPQDRSKDPGHPGSSNSSSNMAFSNCAYVGEDTRGDGSHEHSGDSGHPSQSSANLVAFDECAENNSSLENGNTSSTSNNNNNSNKTACASSARGGGSVEMGGGGARQIAPVAYMIIFGDALHNLIDGLSIGAAFTESTLLGISLSVAVMCEELPHELGDFAILLNSGMSMRKALLYNFLSSLSCYAGLVIGIQLGENTSANTWIFAIAGGMFLYISLADMLPEMNSAAESEDGKEFGEVKTLCVQTFGLVVGFGIILLLAVFGEHISFE